MNLRAHLEEFIKNQFRLADAESRAPVPGGEERVYLTSLYGVVEYGALVRIWGVRREITKQKRDEEALRRSEERYRLFSELASDYVYSIDVSSGMSTSIPVGRRPVGAAVTPDGAELYVANQLDSTVSIVDLSGEDDTVTVAVGSAPTGIALLRLRLETNASISAR